MNSLKRSLLAFALSAVATIGVAPAAVITLDFEGAGSQANLNDFYNGGTDSQGNSGTNYGIQFGSNTLALEEGDPTANFALAPSGDTIMFFLTGTAILNYAAGFDTGFSFWYTTVNFAGTVEVWDDVNATGNLLGSINLNALGTGPSPGNPFSNWAIGSLSFAGVAKSINFGGTVNQVGYDDITFGSADPGGGAIPEPASVALMATGLLGLAIARRRSAVRPSSPRN